MMFTVLMINSNTFDQQCHSRSLLLLSHQGYIQGGHVETQTMQTADRAD